MSTDSFQWVFRQLILVQIGSMLAQKSRSLFRLSWTQQRMLNKLAQSSLYQFMHFPLLQLGNVYVYTGALKGCFPFNCNCSQQLLDFEHCSLKSNKLFKDNAAAHSRSATKVTCSGRRDPRKRLNKRLVVGSKVLKILYFSIHVRVVLIEPLIFFHY